jgi:hypothetical protein
LPRKASIVIRVWMFCMVCSAAMVVGGATGYFYFGLDLFFSFLLEAGGVLLFFFALLWALNVNVEADNKEAF